MYMCAYMFIVCTYCHPYAYAPETYMNTCMSLVPALQVCVHTRALFTYAYVYMLNT